MATDLFEEFGHVAGEYGWRGIGQPERLTRRYGKRIGEAEVTVTVHANRQGTGIVAAHYREVTLLGNRLTRVLDPHDRGKRDTVIDWLREA